MEKLPNNEVLEKEQSKEILLEKIDGFIVGLEPKIIERINTYESNIDVDQIKSNIKDSLLEDVNFAYSTREKMISKSDKIIERLIRTKDSINKAKEKAIDLTEDEFSQMEESGNEYIIGYFHSLKMNNKESSFEEIKNLFLNSVNESICQYQEDIEKELVINRYVKNLNLASVFDLLSRKFDGALNQTEKQTISLMGYVRHNLEYGMYNPITNNIKIWLLNPDNSEEMEGTVIHEVTHMMLNNLVDCPSKKSFIARLLKKINRQEEENTGDFNMALVAIDEALAYYSQRIYGDKNIIPPYDSYRFIDPETFKVFFESIEGCAKDMNIEEFDLFSKDVYLYFFNKKDINSAISYIKNYNVNNS